ncbi:hypothetical protein [Nocardia brasiliensis]|uniref:hypothetical protein n=1 Tax=Nocardia brasiliensis TaxID=37326 RepID=UPI001EECD4C6|nr:hypothetical protein [Nocardia brasiliensis]
MNGERSTGFFGRVTGRGAGRADEQRAGTEAPDHSTDQPGEFGRSTEYPRSTAPEPGVPPADDQRDTAAEHDNATGEHASGHGDHAKSRSHQDDPGDGLAELAAELKLLAEAVLERVEPVLRRAADGQVEWSSCDWCPVCAAAALVRGEHHEVLRSVADHGTAIVTVLREALAGVPVDPVMPEHEHATPHHDSTAGRTGERPARARYVEIPVTIKA